MYSDNRLLPTNVRSYIIGQVENNTSYSTIVTNVEKNFRRTISKGTITKLYDKFEETKTVDDLPRSGRPHIFNQNQEQALINAALDDRQLTATDLSRDRTLNKPHATDRTIRNILSQEGLIASTTQPKFIPSDAYGNRVTFAQKYIETPQIWPTIVFSDEADLYPFKSGKLYIRRYRQEYPLANYNIYPKWDPRTIKVWGCVGINGVGPLVRYHGTMEHTAYIKILDTYLLKTFPKLYCSSTRPGVLSFQQDGAGAHREHHVVQWFKSQNIRTLEWPSYSPDLSPIENLWGILQDRLYEKNNYLKNADDVWKESQKIWYNELNVYVPDLYKSMPLRIEEVLERNGGRLDV